MSTYQNLTISIPEDIIKMLFKFVNKGNRSKFITKAVEDKLWEKKIEKKFDIVEDTKRIHAIYGGTIKHSEVKKLIEKGRM
jgi:metal-responsive CopG/Arc/MetJ family transcriptional regulator